VPPIVRVLHPGVTQEDSIGPELSGRAARSRFARVI